MTNLQNSSVPPKRKPHLNPSAREWTCKDAPDTSSIATFHQAFPQYSPTPLTALPALAAELGIRDLYVKDESRRCGLPSFKILGASWASFRAIAVHVGLSTHSELESVKRAAQRKGIVLVAATDGNHGRAVARVARILGITAQILVPKDVNYCEIDFIRDEGAEVTVLDEDYDSTVQRAKTFAAEAKSRILVQDTAFDGYEQVPQWIVDGYSTMMNEIDDALGDISPDLVVTPVGVGSLAQAVVQHCKSRGRATRVLAVEADAAACLWESLEAGTSVSLDTSRTIMSGMNCGTVSTEAWPLLRSGIDMSVAVSDQEAHQAVQDLKSHGVYCGPCGAATLTGLRAISLTELGLSEDSVVVLLSTEGSRSYDIPLAS